MASEELLRRIKCRTFGDNRFDMIHARFTLGSVSDYSTLFKRIFSALKPGAYFEISDMESGTFSDDGTVTPDMACVKWWSTLSEAFEKLGKPIIPIERYPQLMEETGFDDIHWDMLKRPTNDWPRDPRMKEIGRVGCLAHSHVKRSTVRMLGG